MRALVDACHISDTVVVSHEAQQTREGICLPILGEPADELWESPAFVEDETG